LRCIATYEQISYALGYADKSGAWRSVEGELRELRQERARDVLDLELARLDALLAGSWAKALDGDHRAVANVLRIQERRAKYLDLDRPVDPTEGMTSDEPAVWLLDQGGAPPRVSVLFVLVGHGAATTPTAAPSTVRKYGPRGVRGYWGCIGIPSAAGHERGPRRAGRRGPVSSTCYASISRGRRGCIGGNASSNKSSKWALLRATRMRVVTAVI
jgi:hypothetical protein